MKPRTYGAVLGALGRDATFVAALAAAVGCRTAPTPPPPPPPTVYVTTASKRDVALSIEAVGVLDGYVNADIRARVAGYLERQAYKDGGPVKAGQLLFTIERTKYAAAVSAAQAELDRARVNQKYTRIQLERDRGLTRSGVVSRQDLDTATANADAARSAVRAAEAEVRRTTLDLSYTEVRSPLDGFAGVALVRIGNLVGQNEPTLLAVVSDLDPIRVNFPMSEIDYVSYPERFKHFEERTLAWARRQFPRLDAGNTAEDGDPGIEVLLSDGTRYPHRAVIVAADREIDPSTGTIKLQALIPNPNGLLRPGQYGRVLVPRTQEGSNVITVPDKALISVQGTYSVAVVREGKVELRRVEVGPSAGGVRIVRKGLDAGEQVVVDGVQKVKDGAKVTAKPVTADAPPPPGAAPSQQPAP